MDKNSPFPTPVYAILTTRLFTYAINLNGEYEEPGTAVGILITSPVYFTLNTKTAITKCTYGKGETSITFIYVAVTMET